MKQSKHNHGFQQAIKELRRDHAQLNKQFDIRIAKSKEKH